MLVFILYILYKRKKKKKKLGIFIEKKKSFEKLPQTKGKTGHNKPTVKTDSSWGFKWNPGESEREKTLDSFMFAQLPESPLKSWGRVSS